MGSWPKPRRPLQWLNFKWLQGLGIQGAGTVDGQSISANTSQVHDKNFPSFLSKLEKKLLASCCLVTIISVPFSATGIFNSLAAGPRNEAHGMHEQTKPKAQIRIPFRSRTEPALFQLLRFYRSLNVTVRNIRISNSPNCHLKFDSSGSIEAKNVTISSPGDSLNTDGIHLQNTRDVDIRSSNIGCGKCLDLS
jgi:galacturan 1,4-alpha-galacturonidase